MSYRDDDALPRAAVDVVAGYGAVVAAAFLAAGVLPDHDLAARAVTLAVVVTAAAALIEDWRAAAGVTVFAALVFVGFLDHRFGVLTGDGSAWSYTPFIVAGAVLGRGWHARGRRPRRRLRAADDSPSPVR
jgi:hypothetical protein